MSKHYVHHSGCARRNQTFLQNSDCEFLLERNDPEFADIAKATPNQLQSLPGFVQVKVKRMTDAFEKPFRNKSATSLLIFVPSREHDDIAFGISQTKDRDQATSVVATGSLQVSRRSRGVSPPWDIEFDLNLPDYP
jgi:DNA excision repair protein ERCC-1